MTRWLASAAQPRPSRSDGAPGTPTSYWTATRCEEITAALWPTRGRAKEALALAFWSDRRLKLLGFTGQT